MYIRKYKMSNISLCTYDYMLAMVYNQFSMLPFYALLIGKRLMNALSDNRIMQYSTHRRLWSNTALKMLYYIFVLCAMGVIIAFIIASVFSGNELCNWNMVDSMYYVKCKQVRETIPNLFIILAVSYLKLLIEIGTTIILEVIFLYVFNSTMPGMVISELFVVIAYLPSVKFIFKRVIYNHMYTITGSCDKYIDNIIYYVAYNCSAIIIEMIIFYLIIRNRKINDYRYLHNKK